MQTIDQLLDALGGAKIVARAAGVGVTAVLNWRARGKIPAHAAFALTDLANAHGVMLDRSLFGGPATAIAARGSAQPATASMHAASGGAADEDAS